LNLSENSLRQEIKYKVFIKDINFFYSWLFTKSLFSKSYQDRNVYSLYFDTANYDFAASNMSGESRRIKFRARWYNNEPDFKNSFTKSDQRFNFELKRKFNNLSDKILFGTYCPSNKESFLLRKQEIKREFEYSLRQNRYNFYLRDSIFTGYSREYYEHCVNKNIRLTVDKNIEYFANGSDLKSNTLSKDYLIIELKFNPKDKIDALNIMKDFPFRQVRSSKYLASLSQVKRVSY